MTIVSSGAISINSLVGEYGGSAPHSMSEYYKGGSLVGNHTNNPNVPTSGTIALNNFYGANNTSPVTHDEYANFVNDHSSVTIAKSTSYYRGWVQNILVNAGSVGNDPYFNYGGTNIYLAGAWVGQGYEPTLQIYSGGTSTNPLGYETLVNGKTCIIAGVNCGTINQGWIYSTVYNSTYGGVFQHNFLSGGTALWNALSTVGATYTVRIY